jgi:hypothetical protein
MNAMESLKFGKWKCVIYENCQIDPLFVFGQKTEKKKKEEKEIH